MVSGHAETVGLVGPAVADAADVADEARATAIVTLPILLYVNELREQCSIPRICLTDQQILDLIDTRANAGDTLTATAEYIAPLAGAEWTKPRRRPRKKTKSATRRPWPPSLRTLKMTLAKKPWSCENQGSLARLIGSLTPARDSSVPRKSSMW